MVGENDRGGRGAWYDAFLDCCEEVWRSCQDEGQRNITQFEAFDNGWEEVVEAI